MSAYRGIETYQVKVIKFREDAIYPEKATQGSSGYDLFACIPKETEEDGFVNNQCVIMAGKSKAISTGLNFIIPQGYEVQIRPKSGLAIKHGVTVLNTPGTVDSDFYSNTGNPEDFEVKVILYNTSDKYYVVKHGDKIAQAVICRLTDREMTDESGNSLIKDGIRIGGFGSTGMRSFDPDNDHGDTLTAAIPDHK